jgi:rhomboid protease GluP
VPEVNANGRNSQLCPNCRRLISSDEPICPYCGISSPGGRWKNTPLTRGVRSEQLVRAILYVNIGMFFLSIVIFPRGLSFNPFTVLSPTRSGLKALGATGTWIGDILPGWWTMISANYLHGSLLHIAFNMIALYQISPLICQLFGSNRYFIIYTLSGVAGFYLSYSVGIDLTIGASAAICGLIGAAIYYGKNRGGVFGQAIYRQVGGWALGTIFFGFMIPGINNWAHIGGMLAGALLAMFLGYNEKRRETLVHRRLFALLIVFTALVLFWAVLRGFSFLFSLR